MMSTQNPSLTVIQIAPCFIDMSRETGGVANVVRHISRQLSARSIRVIIFCGNRELGKVCAEPKRYIAENVEVIVLEQRSHPLLGPTQELKRLLAGVTGPYVAHVHTCFSALTETAMKFFYRNDIPYILSTHGKLSPNMLGKHKWAKHLWWHLYSKQCVHNAFRIVACSPIEALSYSDIGIRKNVCVVPNGYDSSFLSSIESYQNRIIDEPYILFLGYLDPRKQPELLVRAFAASNARSRYKLVLAGPDAYGHLEKINHEIDLAGIRDRVVLYGPAYGEVKWQLLKQASCFCLPSKGEGLPVALCEALGAGLPLIISDACNFRDAATSGAAIELNYADVKKWAESIDSVCLDDRKKTSMSEAAKMMSTQYTWDHLSDQWISIYNEMLK